jgi:hypothetical protein
MPVIVVYFTAPMRANKSLIHKHSNSKHLFIDLLTRVLESPPRPRSAVVLNTVQVASLSREASLCKQLVKLGLGIALDYGHSKCRDSDTSEGLTGRSTRLAVPSSSTALALLLGRLVRPTVERPHPGTNPPLLPANLQSTLRAVGPLVYSELAPKSLT